jgi:HTH-type transcriptional regulator / antitoxin HigA
MKTKVLKTEAEYNDACARIYKLINSSENAIDPTGTEGEELELTTKILECFKNEA